MKKALVLGLLSLVFNALLSQVTLAFQGFEGLPSDNWAFTPPTQNLNTPMLAVGAGNYGAGYAATGARSLRMGGGSTTCGSGSGNCIINTPNGGSCTNNLNGQSIEFEQVNVECFENVQLSVKHRTHVFCTGQGQGFDAGENIRFEVNLNGAGWTMVGQLNGNANCVWLYSDNPVVCGASTIPNPFVYNIPNGTQSVAFRVVININRTDEVLYLDDILLTGIQSVLPPITIEHINQ